MSDLLDAALAYSAKGYRVFPCQPGGKAPATSHGCHDATSDEARIREYWSALPGANVGLATAGLLVVDVDGADNPWPGDQDRAGDLMGVPISLTPGGGRHLIFHARGKGYSNTVSRLGPRVDTRGEGGYIIVPPSRIGSRSYRWAEYCDLSRLDDLPSPPAWLVEALDDQRPRAAVRTRK